MGSTWFKTGVAAMAATALVAAGCGGNDNEATSAAPATQESTIDKTSANPTETKAAELRAGLTALLQEHVYLAGTAISQGVGNGLDSGEFKASAATLDDNSVALSNAIGSVYGNAAGQQFLALWRDHIGFFVNYAKGDKGAKADLDGYRAEFGAFLAGANPNLTEEAVAEELKPHVASVFAVIDSLKAKDGKTFDLLREAAGHMPGTANVLAGAIDAQKKLDGRADSSASELRSGLTALLQEHVYLAGTAVVQGVGNGLDSGEFKAAAATLDANSIALSEAIGSAYGKDAEKQFLALWRDHIGMFVAYTKAKAANDEAGVKKAERDLDGYRAEFGAFLGGANPNLTEEAVAEELKPHVESVFDTIDSVVAKDGKAFDLLREAAGHMPGTANVLAGAIAKQFPEKFGDR